ncbi:hypothetical protein FPS14_contig00004-0072 [Flavobacterium psychrophilum]|nr:hypothetical protein FPS14_contig00004-0072 [Flavobacterium psychrophilum]
MILDSNKLYDLMADRGFQEPRTGNLFFPAYIYTYNPELEYEMRKEIAFLIEKLKRPNNYLECLVINMYEEMIDFLKAEEFSGRTLFDLITEKEKKMQMKLWRGLKTKLTKGIFIKILLKSKNAFW